jgi:hypothetical protein
MMISQERFVFSQLRTTTKGKVDNTMHNVFLSFAMEDKCLVDLFQEQAKNNHLLLEFRDYSIKEPFEEAWKTHCEEIIRHCSLTICLVGHATRHSEAVNWEIRKSIELSKGVMAVYLVTGYPRLPQALLENSIIPIRWNMDEIMNEIRRVAK